jgi:hypothetical protein
MKKRPRKKADPRRQLRAEVEVETMTADHEWAPHLSQEDAYKLDDVREALGREDYRLGSSSQESIHAIFSNRLNDTANKQPRMVG